MVYKFIRKACHPQLPCYILLFPFCTKSGGHLPSWYLGYGMVPYVPLKPFFAFFSPLFSLRFFPSAFLPPFTKNPCLYRPPPHSPLTNNTNNLHLLLKLPTQLLSRNMIRSNRQYNIQLEGAKLTISEGINDFIQNCNYNLRHGEKRFSPRKHSNHSVVSSLASSFTYRLEVLLRHVKSIQPNPFECRACEFRTSKCIEHNVYPKFVITLGKEYDNGNASYLYRVIACQYCFKRCFKDFNDITPVLQTQAYSELLKNQITSLVENVILSPSEQHLGKFLYIIFCVHSC